MVHKVLLRAELRWLNATSDREEKEKLDFEDILDPIISVVINMIYHKKINALIISNFYFFNNLKKFRLHSITCSFLSLLISADSPLLSTSRKSASSCLS